MDAELKERWIEALTSGKYKQGVTMLKTRHNEFCCLGVLCDIQGVDLDSRDAHDRYGGMSYPLPEHEAGLSSQHLFDVAGMNDAGNTFSQIADWIEQNVPTA